MISSAEAAGSARMQSNCSGEKLLTAKLLVFFVAFISWLPWWRFKKMLNKFSFFFGWVQLSRTGEFWNHIWFSFFGGESEMQTRPHVLAVLQPPQKKECGSFAGKTNRHPEDESEIQQAINVRPATLINTGFFPSVTSKYLLSMVICSSLQ